MRLESDQPGSPASWLRHARSDLALASVDAPEEVLASTLCFHAQQAVEKALKAALIHFGTTFPKTHNIRYLLDQLADSLAVPGNVDEAAILTKYAVQMRYPEDLAPVSDQDRQDAILMATAVVDWVAETVRGSSAPHPEGKKL